MSGPEVFGLYPNNLLAIADMVDVARNNDNPDETPEAPGFAIPWDDDGEPDSELVAYTDPAELPQRSWFGFIVIDPILGSYGYSRTPVAVECGTGEPLLSTIEPAQLRRIADLAERTDKAMASGAAGMMGMRVDLHWELPVSIWRDEVFAGVLEDEIGGAYCFHHRLPRLPKVTADQ